MLLIIDNYDSFTFNLAQLIGRYRQDILVKRNDQIDCAAIREMMPDRIVLSPGPGRPENAGVTMEVIKDLGREVPILGVCLGHQAIGAAFGAKVVHAPYLMHGRVSAIRHCCTGIYAGVPDPFTATRYHSLVIEPATLPDELQATAWTDDGVVMGVRHKTLPIEGVQFHPESILTDAGSALMSHWLQG